MRSMANVGMKTFTKQFLKHSKIKDFIDWKDEDVAIGKTMLLFAIARERVDIALLLVDHGADISITDNTGTDALMFAARGGNLELTKVLLEKGADTSMTNQAGETALSLATSEGIVELLSSQQKVA